MDSRITKIIQESIAVTAHMLLEGIADMRKKGFSVEEILDAIILKCDSLKRSNEDLCDEFKSKHKTNVRFLE
jgi:hypothetical protein